MRAFITGISGFVGRHLTGLLTSHKWEVSGFDQRATDQNVLSYIGDISITSALADALRERQPEVIFHLAGVLKVNAPQDFYMAHVIGTVSLFEAILAAGLKPLVLVASSGAVYGPGIGRSRPIRENFAMQPVTDYAASKVSQEMVARRYFLAYKIPVICTRTFNLVGPGQPPIMACSAFARQIMMAEQQTDINTIKTGNLSAQRDFVDVRDAVRAYELLTLKGKSGSTYNVCSGQAVSIRHCLDLLLSMASKPLKAELDTNRMQKNDIPVQVGSAHSLQRATGWQIEIPLPTSLADLLNDWRERAKSVTE